MSVIDPTGALTLAIFAVCSFTAALCVTGAWVIQSFFLRCKISKVLDYASRNGLTVAAIFKSNHVTKLTPCKVHANGYLETLSKTRNDPKHFIPILRTTFSRPTTDPQQITDTEVRKEEEYNVQEAQAIAQMEKDILPPSYLEGSSCPIYFVYDGLAVAVTAEALLGLGVPYKQFSYNARDKAGAFIKELKLNIALPLNPQLPKKYLTKLYDQSTVDGYGQDRWQAGWLARGKSMDGNIKLMFMCGFGLIICGAAMLVAAFFL
jgi:hypothetical protein